MTFSNFDIAVEYFREGAVRRNMGELLRARDAGLLCGVAVKTIYEADYAGALSRSGKKPNYTIPDVVRWLISSERIDVGM